MSLDKWVKQRPKVLAALHSLAVIDEYDCPGDTPIVVGEECLLCKASWSGEPAHKADCLLAGYKPKIQASKAKRRSA